MVNLTQQVQSHQGVKKTKQNRKTPCNAPSARQQFDHTGELKFYTITQPQPYTH